MIICKTKKWGSSLGLIIPKKEVEKLDLKEDQDIVIDIVKKDNPLKELFGFSKSDKITKDDVTSVQELLESNKF